MSEISKTDYLDKASTLKVEDGYDTTMQTCIELSVKIKELEERIKVLEGVKR